jgi:hypothetical protein
LLERIKEKPTSVLVPIIDVIEAKNFYYSTNGYDSFQVKIIQSMLINGNILFRRIINSLHDEYNRLVASHGMVISIGMIYQKEKRNVNVENAKTTLKSVQR